MNVALTTIIIIILFLPGIVFRRSYYSEPFSYRYISSNILFDIANSIIPSFFIHLIAIAIIEKSTKYKIDFYIIEKLFSDLNYTRLDSPLVKIKEFFPQIFFYFVVVLIFSIFIGHLSRFLIIKCNLDTKFRFLHFNNEWYYLFNARYIKSKLKEIEKNNPEIGKVDIKKDLIIYLDLMVESGSDVIIYKGILDDFTLEKDGGLETIRIKKVSKQKYQILADNLNAKERKKAKSSEQTIPGYSVVFPVDLIKNINVRYIIYKEENNIQVA